MSKQINGFIINLNKLIGQGSFKSVYKGVNMKTGQEVAIKIQMKQKESLLGNDRFQQNAIIKEIKIMTKIKSDNIVKLFDFQETKNCFYIIEELCDCDLSKIMKYNKIISEAKAIQYLTQIANGMYTLVSEGVLHRDLKPANIMMKGNILKIGDFGQSKQTQFASQAKKQSYVGSPLYNSLERLKNIQYSSKCDIWSMGLIFYEMLHGKVPWPARTEYELINKIQTQPIQINAQLGNKTKDFLKQCLEIKQQNRISWNQLFKHPIFNDYFSKNANENIENENKFKSLISNLRFQINSQNLNLQRILNSLGYNARQKQLNEKQFLNFLKTISPFITKQMANKIYSKVDEDKNGKISLQQLEQMFNSNHIYLYKHTLQIPGYESIKKNEQFFGQLPAQTQQKVKTCFNKLMKQILIDNKCKLKNIFDVFNKNGRNFLDRNQFRNMLIFISEEVDDEEIDAAFKLIDEDDSNSVQFEQLNLYYNKINGLPDPEGRKYLHYYGW